MLCVGFVNEVDQRAPRHDARVARWQGLGEKGSLVGWLVAEVAPMLPGALLYDARSYLMRVISAMVSWRASFVETFPFFHSRQYSAL
jgi:hypothetical protein